MGEDEFEMIERHASPEAKEALHNAGRPHSEIVELHEKATRGADTMRRYSRTNGFAKLWMTAFGVT